MTIRPIATLEEMEQVFAQAKEDGHSLVAPSLAVTEKGEVRGAISFIPMALVWMHTQRNKIRDSLAVKTFLENHVASNGARYLCLPCVQSSPYFPFMEQWEYVNVGSYNLFVKGV